MESPVTRRELREDLQGYATKKDLEAWGHEIVRYLETRLDQKLDEKFDQKFAHYFRALSEEFRSWVTTALEPHADIPERVKELAELPPRVAKLEAKVFAPRRKRR